MREQHNIIRSRLIELMADGRLVKTAKDYRMLKRYDVNNVPVRKLRKTGTERNGISVPVSYPMK